MTRSSKSRSRVLIWVLSVFGVALAVEFVLFVEANQVFHQTVAVLTAPYMVFPAMPFFCLVFSMWLRKLEDRSVSPRWLALGWGLLIALFFSGIAAGVFYSGVKFHVIDPGEFWLFFTVESAPTIGFSVMTYKMALKRISARAPANGTTAK